MLNKSYLSYTDIKQSHIYNCSDLTVVERNYGNTLNYEIIRIIKKT